LIFIAGTNKFCCLSLNLFVTNDFQWQK